MPVAQCNWLTRKRTQPWMSVMLDGIFSKEGNEHLYVWVFGAGCSPLSSTAFLLAVWIELWVAEDRHPDTLVLQRQGRWSTELLFCLRRYRQDNGNGQVNCPSWGEITRRLLHHSSCITHCTAPCNNYTTIEGYCVLYCDCTVLLLLRRLLFYFKIDHVKRLPHN